MEKCLFLSLLSLISHKIHRNHVHASTTIMKQIPCNERLQLHDTRDGELVMSKVDLILWIQA